MSFIRKRSRRCASDLDAHAWHPRKRYRLTVGAHALFMRTIIGIDEMLAEILSRFTICLHLSALASRRRNA